MKTKGNSFLILVLLFLAFGILMIGDVSLLEAERSFGNKFYFLKHQLIWVGLGLAGAGAVSLIDYHRWKKYSFFLYLVSLVGLLAVLLPGIGVVVNGARRWIDLGFFGFQPSELAKLALLLYLSSLFTVKEKAKLGHFFLVLLPPVALTLIEPDFGTAAIMVAIGLMIYFLSGAKIEKIVAPALIFFALGVIFIFASPYRKERVFGLLDPFYDPLGKSYHAHQLTLTLGSGGIAGVGMGQSRQKYLYLPEVTTDSILAVVAEEFGLIGITVFIVLFGTMILSAFRIALSAPDPLGMTLGGGIAAWIAIQGLINLSAVAVVLPLTGVPFPFISYGGSSLVSILAGVGILLNIGKREK